MLRQFIYKPEHAGLTEWPSGELRLDGIDVTENPQEADVFVCPGNIRVFEAVEGTGKLDMEKLNRLPYFKGNEARTVFFDVSDNFKTAINLPIIFLRCDLRNWMEPTDIGSLNFAWPVDDFSECLDLPEGGLKYDVSFQGWLSSEVRKQSAEACRNNPLLKSDIATYPDFCGYIYHEPEGVRRRSEFRRSMKESRICLCPESIPGVFPYRYWEALSAGRVPLLVGSDFVYPFSEEISYESFAITCPRNLADKADELALDFIHSHSDDEIVEMGKLGRRTWATWHDSRLWPKLHAEAVMKKLGVLCAS